MIGYIYLISNNINNKVYVGQTTQSIEKRWSGHKSDLNRGYNFPLYNSMNKYGIDNFSIKEIAKVESDNCIEYLDLLETEYIKAYNSIAPNGYNLETGGKNYKHHSDSILKIKLGLKDRKLSEKHKEKISKSLIGLKRSEEVKSKMSIAQKLCGNKPPNRKGTKHSEESKLKMSIAHLRRKEYA